MSNHTLNVSGESLARLKIVMGLSSALNAVGVSASDGRLVFFWTKHDAMQPFPSPLNMDLCAEIAFDWLQKSAKYGPEPDHDGDNHRGWRCFTEDWGFISPFGYPAFIAVVPYWVEYGK